MITDHIKTIEGITDVKVNIVWPEKELFISDQKPVTISVIIKPNLRNSFTQNLKMINSIQMLLKLAIEGVQDENIIIVDQNGSILNNFK